MAQCILGHFRGDTTKIIAAIVGVQVFQFMIMTISLTAAAEDFIFNVVKLGYLV